MNLNKRESEEIFPTKSRILLYQTEDGRQRIEVRLEDGTVWLNQRLMAELFQVGVNTINYHIKEIYKEVELLPEATIRKYRIVQNEGSRQVSRQMDFYNLVNWKAKLDAFLELNDQDILTHAGRISAEIARDLAHKVYEKFADNRRLIDADQADEELRFAVQKLSKGKNENET